MSVKTNFNYPECWEDDVRMNALFSPFRPKSINPDNYSNKLQFWKTLICDFCKLKQGSPVFTKNDLENAFKRKGQIPHCLNTVIEEMVNQNIIREKSDFFKNTTYTWTSWILCNLIKSPWKWGYNKLIPKSNQGISQFIHCNLLKELSSDLDFILQKHCGKVFSLDELKREIDNEIFLNDVGLKVCLYNLNLQNAISLDIDMSGNDFNIKLIKIPSKSNPSEKLTDIDRNLHNLKETQKHLAQEMKDMELQISEYNNLARKHIKINNRKLAEVYLRKKHYLQKKCEKRGDVLFNMEALITNIKEAQDNGKVISAFKMGSETLQSLNSKLTLENVDEIMSTMEDVLNNHAEIQDSFSNFDLTDINDTTLEKELNELLLTENGNLEDVGVENDQNDVLEQLSHLKIESCTPSTKKNSVIEN